MKTELSKETGFTLVEVLVVIGILVLFAGGILYLVFKSPSVTVAPPASSLGGPVTWSVQFINNPAGCIGPGGLTFTIEAQASHPLFTPNPRGIPGRAIFMASGVTFNPSQIINVNNSGLATVVLTNLIPLGSATVQVVFIEGITNAETKMATADRYEIDQNCPP